MIAMFKIECDKFFQLPTLKTKVIGHYSIDGDSEYHADLSQLKYYKPPSNLNNINYDLNTNIAFTRLKPTSYIKLDDILKWILDNFKVLKNPFSTQERWLNVDFICRRGALNRVMTSPYVNGDWIICASKYRGTIYLCEFYSDEKERYHTSPTVIDKQKESWGFKFEQYMVADHPSHQPNTSVPVNACEAFHCVFRADFGHHSLLYEAEIDGISSSEETNITDTLVGKQVEIIELKTLYLPEIGELHAKLSPQRVSNMWSQNYLANVKRTIFGLRHEKSSVVRMIKEYSTDDLPKLSFAHCDVNKCKIFFKLFLDNVKKIVTKDHDECMYKFYWNKRNGNVVNYSEEKPDDEKYIFLKPQFIHTADKYK